MTALGILAIVWSLWGAFCLGEHGGHSKGFREADSTIDARGGMSVDRHQRAKQRLKEVSNAGLSSGTGCVDCGSGEP